MMCAACCVLYDVCCVLHAPCCVVLHANIQVLLSSFLLLPPPSLLPPSFSSSKADEIAADVRRFADKIVGGDRHGEQRAKQMAMAVANKAAQERVAAHRRQVNGFIYYFYNG